MEIYDKLTNLQRVADLLTALDEYTKEDMSALYLDFIEQGNVTTKELIDYTKDLSAIIDSMIRAIKVSDEQS